MPVIVVANPKGGVGKSTVSTNLAGYLARQGHAVMLGDADRQQSSAAWLAQRAPELPPIRGWELTEHEAIVRPPKGTTHLVLDTPAGLHGKRLDAVMKLADRVLVPLQASLFDIRASAAFLAELQARRKHAKVPLAVLGNRVREHTHAAQQLQDFLGQLGVPVLGPLRETQHYVQLAAHGLTLWDVAPGRVEKDLAQWQTVLDWLRSD